jgi:hypothetical protein
MGRHFHWIAVYLAVISGMGAADRYGYTPGTCTDSRAASVQPSQPWQGQQPASRGQLAPCSSSYTSNSIRNRHYYGGK